ncbi:permease of ferrichrome ABC transporter [Klebsiella pneumoniae]|uniref:Permease of ferrichrome ABC transporter n=1 Tax=Klebsiella pneumoniae TaxID=573 RepID=A0A2X3GI24_KLEPN|nr:permease of ferrichrome ABC transporter [Klebsiella pneumoniae]
MTRAVHRAGFRPLAFASRQLLLRPAALKIAASIVLTLLALGLYSLSRGSYPLPASTLARALLAPQEMGEQPRFILFDIRLPRILMALLCGPCWGWPARRCRASPVTAGRPGADRRQRGGQHRGPGAGAVFPAVGLVWRPLAGMVGGIAVALLVLTLARDCSRPRFILIASASPGAWRPRSASL